MNRILEPLWKATLEQGHLVPDPLGGGQGIRSGLLEESDGDPLLAVEPTADVVAPRPQLRPADVTEAHDRLPRGGQIMPGADATGGDGRGARRERARGLDDHVLEGCRIGEPSGRGHRHLEVEAEGGRWLADPPGGHLDILLAQGAHDIGGREPAAGELAGIEPHPQGVVAGPEKLDVPHPLDARQRILHLEKRVIGNEQLIEPLPRREEIHAQEDARRLLPRRHPLPAGFLGELRQRHRHPVLRQHLGLVDVGAELEGDVDRRLAVAGALRRQIEHPLDAVDLLLDRRGDRLGDDLRPSAGIERGDGDRGRGDIRILPDRHADQRHAADEEDHHREDGGEDGPVDEELREHAATVIPWRAGPGLRPAGRRPRRGHVAGR